MLGAAVSFVLLMLLPIDFPYPGVRARSCCSTGSRWGMFASPNRAAVMNSLPPGDRGAGGGMNQTFQNSAQVLSIGIFFTLMIVGLAVDAAARRCAAGCRRTASPPRRPSASATLPPVSILFAAFLGYNPIQHLVGPHVLAALPAHDQRSLTGRSFFPQLISGPFRDGLHAAFAFAIVACLVAAGGIAAARRPVPHATRPWRDGGNR